MGNTSLVTVSYHKISSPGESGDELFVSGDELQILPLRVYLFLVGTDVHIGPDGVLAKSYR